MAELVDPDTLLEWLQSGSGDDRDVQLMALEQLCMLLLMSDNIDRCFESCPPRSFLPALCRIFVDDEAPSQILEVTARAITYYLDVSAECTRRIVAVDGSVKAICSRLSSADMGSRTGKDLAEQCIKVLEFICTREAQSVFEAGGLKCVLTFVREHGSSIHRDTLHSSMSVITRLCSKLEPGDSSLLESVESLSLLCHDDTHVCESTLRCFATISDRYMRKGVDPAPLASHGLIHHLISRLQSSGQVSVPNSTAASTASGVQSSVAPASAVDVKAASSCVSIVIGLLSSLCRGSPTVTKALLESDLCGAVENTLQRDERCCLDTMRLVDLLLLLTFEGRQALPKVVPVAVQLSSCVRCPSVPGSLSRSDSDRAHRHLIDCIRSKDTDALIDAVEQGKIEVNFMDDVGQTLLNWASAFGTPEMVEYLCERGADVNRGQRSSSLHYASCFGRPNVTKILLRFGANPDLRDEDGKTALDRARERNDEGHREVASILESPSEWMVPYRKPPDEPRSRDQPPSDSIESENEFAPTTTTDNALENTEESPMEGTQTSNEATVALAPDMPISLELANNYIQRMLSIFCRTFRQSLIPSLRRGALNLVKKLIRYSTPVVLREVCGKDYFAEKLVEALSLALDNDEDEEGQNSSLCIIKDLLEKEKEYFLEQFVRLGVFEKVHKLTFVGADESFAQKGIFIPVNAPASSVAVSPTLAENAPAGEPKEIQLGRSYYWKDWCLVRGRDCLYVWSDVVALELSNGSNGWFRYVMDGKLATMYSSGSPEGGSDGSENRTEFQDKLQKARAAVKGGASAEPLFQSAKSSSIVNANWILQCMKLDKLQIKNIEGHQQNIILSEDSSGFAFESNRCTQHTFQAATKSTEPSIEAAGISGQRSRTRLRLEVQKNKVREMATEIFSKYGEEAKNKPRSIAVHLHKIVGEISTATNLCERSSMAEYLHELQLLLRDEHAVSTFEVYNSGLVKCLLGLFTPVRKEFSACEFFIENFCSGGDESSACPNPIVLLVKKLISVLEIVEKMDQYFYDMPGSVFGLQLLVRRLRFRLEKAAGETVLIDRSGKSIKMEPLASVGQLRSYMRKTVAKQWYDGERASYTFVEYIRQHSVELNYVSDFDENGLIYWLGTNAKTSEFVNPAQFGIVNVTSSDGRSLPYGNLSDILSRDPIPINCHTNDDKKGWFTIDTGVFIIPTSYTLRHARGYSRSALRNWLFMVSRDNQSWITLHTHKDDASLNDPGSTATWPITVATEETQGWRYFRIQQNGKNSSGQTHYLSISGFEMYGRVTGVVEDLVRPRETELLSKKQKRMARQKLLALGARVARTPDWKWRERDGPPSTNDSYENAESKPTDMNNAWVDVLWESNRSGGAYRTRGDGKNDINHPFSSQHHDATLAVLHALSSRSHQSHVSHVPLSRAFRAMTSSRGRHSTSSVLTSRKSMSTTNLFEVLDKNSEEVSVASTDQAASAENLRNHTPSLENLLARSRLRDEMPLTAGIQRLMPESIAESRVEDLSSSPETAEPFQYQKESDVYMDCGANAKENKQKIAESIAATVLRQAAKEAFVAQQMDDKSGDEISFLSELAQALSGSGVHQSQPPGDFNVAPFESGNTVLVQATPESLSPFLFPAAWPELPATNRNQSSTDAANNVRNSLATLSVSAPNLSGASPAQSDSVSGLLANLTRGNNVSNLSDLGSSQTIEDIVRIAMSAQFATSIMPNSAQSSPSLIVANPLSTTASASVNAVSQQVVSALGETLVSLVSTSTDSEQDFGVEPNRVLAELEDDEIVEAEEDHENEDDNDDEEFVSEEFLEAAMAGRRRNWDEDVVLKCQFPSLIPAFDPRPGRTNVNQTQDIEVPPNSAALFTDQQQSPAVAKESNLKLSIRFSGGSDVEVVLDNDEMPIFFYVQKLLQKLQLVFKADKARKIWDGQYTIAYELSPQSSASCARGCISPCLNSEDASAIEEVLRLLKSLQRLLLSPETFGLSKSLAELVSPENFVSNKVTQKLLQQLQDPLVVASCSFPDWCDYLMYTYPMLFPFDVRKQYFYATAFGPSRAIVWLQDQRDKAGEASRASTRVREELQEYRVGRIKHERVRVSRGGGEDDLLQQAVNILHFHASRKAILEVEFLGEEGTGLGPTLEFYALVAAELSRKSLAIWICDDDDEFKLQEGITHSSLHGSKPRGYYVCRPHGFFPAPFPQNHPGCDRAVELFRFLGVFLGKVLLDSRLVDIPLSLPLLKLLCHFETSEEQPTSRSYTGESQQSNWNVYEATVANGPCWHKDVLSLGDFELIQPGLAKFIRQLMRIIEQRDKGNIQEELLDDGTSLADISLTFQINPSSNVYGYQHVELCPGGDMRQLTVENIDDYVSGVLDFYFGIGIKRQLMALKDGLSRVFPIEKLRAFAPEELQAMISGEQCPVWSYEDLLLYTEPKLGFTRESPGFLRFVECLSEMSGIERKQFLQFTTGCSSLPPGGLANLFPRLTVVRKVDAADGSYPSVNTCVHYLKLPDYSSKEILRDRLLAATKEKGFHLN